MRSMTSPSSRTIKMRITREALWVPYALGTACTSAKKTCAHELTIYSVSSSRSPCHIYNSRVHFLPLYTAQPCQYPLIQHPFSITPKSQPVGPCYAPTTHTSAVRMGDLCNSERSSQQFLNTHFFIFSETRSYFLFSTYRRVELNTSHTRSHRETKISMVPDADKKGRGLRD